MNITVYLGSVKGNDPFFEEKARELGTFIGESGHRLIYGGSNIGLMGILASAAVSSGAEVIGVEPRFLVEKVEQHPDINQLIVVETMSVRKEAMLDLGSIFIAFPGATGTLEEITEAVSRNRLGLFDKPCLFYDLKGYYSNIKEHFNKMIEAGFLQREEMSKIYFPENLEEIKTIIASYEES